MAVLATEAAAQVDKAGPSVEAAAVDDAVGA